MSHLRRHRASMDAARIATLALFGVLSLSSGRAEAWTSIAPGTNPTWPGPARYALNQNGSVDLGGFAATETVVREAIEDWTRVSCSGLETTYLGSSTQSPGSGATTVIGWIESGWPDEPNAIGVTSPAWNSRGELVNAWMAMNGVNFTWTTDAGSGSRVNTYSIALHEGGHYMGLGHSADPSATMYFAYSGGISSMSADDETGICALYPGGGGGAADCTTTGCPSGQVCESGTCVASGGGGGTGGVCDGCTSDAACGGGGLCLRYPDGRGYCGGACVSAADCGGSNESCESVSDGTRQCVRRDAGGNGSCAVGPGDPPGGGSPTGPPDTPPDPGLECTSSRDCADDERCDVSGTCVSVATGDIGDACATSADCVSGLCAVDSARDQTFCTAICSDAAPCPTGYACASAGGGTNACQPDSTATRGSSGLGPGTIVGGCSVATTSASIDSPTGDASSVLVLCVGLVGLFGVQLRVRRRRRHRSGL